MKINLDAFYKAQEKSQHEAEKVVRKAQKHTDIELFFIYSAQDGLSLGFESQDRSLTTRAIPVESFCEAVILKGGKVTEEDLHEYCI